jgi:hypothetical protein
VVLWVVTPYISLGGHQHFGGIYRLRPEDGGDRFLRKVVVYKITHRHNSEYHCEVVSNIGSVTVEILTLGCAKLRS